MQPFMPATSNFGIQVGLGE